MKNFGTLCAVAVLGIFLGGQFLDWVWWFNWENGDEENPAPILCATWGIWRCLRDAYLWLRSGFWRPPQRRLTTMWRRIFRSESPFESMDQDGRTPTEWFFIQAIGIWGMKCWYKDEYDWEVKRKWDEFLKSRDAAPHAEAQQSSGAVRVNDDR